MIPIRRNGFTLVEVLIAVMIMAILSMLTARTIQSATTVKKKIQTGLDQQSALRNVLAVMERDISLAFHYRNINYEVQFAIKQKHDQQKLQQGITADQLEDLPVPPQFTQFEGEGSRLALTSLAHVRIQPEAKECDQMEVGYELRGCKSVFKPDAEGQCLFRRISKDIDKDVWKGGNDSAILEGVTSLCFRYFGDGKDDWVDTWKTGEGADDTTRDKFPYAVEITIEQKEGEKKLKMSTVAEIRFPNNKPKEAPAASANPVR